jgi:hypothetical protein
MAGLIGIGIYFFAVSGCGRPSHPQCHRHFPAQPLSGLDWDWVAHRVGTGDCLHSRLPSSLLVLPASSATLVLTGPGLPATSQAGQRNESVIPLPKIGIAATFFGV